VSDVAHEGPAEAPGDRPLSEMRLRPSRAPVTRLSRKALLVLGGVASVAIGGALLFALRPTHRAAKYELYNTDPRAAPEALGRLPKDYTGFTVPKLGPPLPGDLGRPILAAGAASPPIGGMTADGSATATTAASQNPAQQQIAQEHDAARTSHLFAEASNGASAPSLALPGVMPASPLQAGTGAIPALSVGGSPPAEHGEKLDFLNAATEHRTVSAERLESPPSPDVIQAGAVIPAALITGLRSDLPGEVTAQVTQDVYDSPTGKRLLIPQGARLIGQYDAQVTFGQSRALLVWNRLIMPNGRSIVLERQPGTDPAGYAGLQDRVNDHWGTLLGAAALSTLLSVGSEAGTSNTENNLAQALRQGASQGFSQVGQQVVSRSLNVQPTLTMRPGYPVRVLVTRDIVLEPYAG
jgi:type IV secretory pathway VirB10-like protein